MTWCCASIRSTNAFDGCARSWRAGHTCSSSVVWWAVRPSIMNVRWAMTALIRAVSVDGTVGTMRASSAKLVRKMRWISAMSQSALCVAVAGSTEVIEFS